MTTVKKQIPFRLFPLIICLFGFALSVHAAPLKTQNVILIMSDGLRWQEVFTGADELLVNKTNGGISNLEAVRKNFWRETPEARREALLPFLWSEVRSKGQIFGNGNKGSLAHITNGKKFS